MATRADVAGMIIMALRLAAALSTCGDLCSDEAVNHYARLNAAAALTRRDSERAAFLVRTASGLRTIPWQSGTATEASYSGRIPREAVAVIHTHPIAAPMPSRRDVAEAQRIGLPIVVITPDQISMAGTDGTVAVLFTKR